MSKQYHFVVMYDAATNSFSLDYDTQEAKFGKEVVYDTESESWELIYSGDYYEDESDYNIAGDALAEALYHLKPSKDN